DPLGAEGDGLRGVAGRVGVGADLEPAEPVGPAEERLDVAADGRVHERFLALDDLAGGAVEREPVALTDGDLAVGEGARGVVDGDVTAAGHARLAPPARHDGGVAG